MSKLKCNTVMIALAAALLSASAALADVEPDDRSYLPPQTKEAGKQAPAQTNDRPRYARNGTQRRARTSYAHHGERLRYAHRNARRYYVSRGMFPGIFFGLFR